MGRGASKASGTSAAVPYEKWGKVLDGADTQLIKDETGSIIGKIEDETHFIYEPDVRKITKKQILDEVEAWRNDDGTYGMGDGDESIGIAYKNGDYVVLTELEAGQKWKKSDIAGVSVSTGDYEMAWGEEYNKRTKTWSAIETTEFNDAGDNIAGYTNSYSGRKAVGKYLQRVKTIYGKKNQRETLKKSTVKSLR